MNLILSNEHGLAFLPGRWAELEWGWGGSLLLLIPKFLRVLLPTYCWCRIRVHLPGNRRAEWEGKDGTGKILPGDGESGGPRVRVGLSLVTLGKVPKFLGPQFPLRPLQPLRCYWAPRVGSGARWRRLGGERTSGGRREPGSSLRPPPRPGHMVAPEAAGVAPAQCGA